MTKEEQFENEANVFAVCLLMPRDMFVDAMKKYPLSLADDRNAKIVARIFEVSIAAVVFRYLIHLGKISISQ